MTTRPRLAEVPEQPERTNSLLDSYARMSQEFQSNLKLGKEELFIGYFSLAGKRVQLSCLGQELFETIMRPFAHLEMGAGSPSLSVEVWDSLVDCPLPAQDVSFVVEDQFALHHLPFSTTALNLQERHMVSSVRHRDKLSLYERGRPWHAPFSLWLQARQTPLIHAGAVGRDGRAVLVGGAGGSGKSSSCLASSFHGLDYLGDDMVALEKTASGFRVHSQFGSTFLNPQDLGKYPQLAGTHLSPRYSWEEKLLAFPPTTMTPKSLVSAIVLPTVTGSSRPAKLIPLRPAQVLLGLGPSTHQVGLLSPGRLGFELLADLVQSVPGYRLELGTEPQFAIGSLLE